MTSHTTRLALAVALLFTSVAGVRCASAQTPEARDGVELLARMRSAYNSRWYHTLTFTQQTIIARPNGVADTTTWYETLSGPARLRIDVGDPAQGNGMLYTADSSYVMRAGALRRADGNGNPFLPLIMGVYLQPVSETVRQLRLFGFDLSRTTKGTYEGHPVDIVGTSDAADTVSAQFWIDTEQQIVRRVRGNVKGIGGADIHVGGYERVGKAWLATRIAMQLGGRTQTEVYSDWKVDVPVAESMFDLTQWRTAPHWVQLKR